MNKIQALENQPCTYDQFQCSVVTWLPFVTFPADLPRPESMEKPAGKITSCWVNVLHPCLSLLACTVVSFPSSFSCTHHTFAHSPTLYLLPLCTPTSILLPHLLTHTHIHTHTNGIFLSQSSLLLQAMPPSAFTFPGLPYIFSHQHFLPWASLFSHCTLCPPFPASLHLCHIAAPPSPTCMQLIQGLPGSSPSLCGTVTLITCG